MSDEQNKTPARVLLDAVTKDTRISIGLAILLLTVGLGFAGTAYKLYAGLQDEIKAANENHDTQMRAMGEQLAEARRHHDAQMAAIRAERSAELKVIHDALRELVTQIARDNDSEDRRLDELERQMGNRWSSYMMELWVAQCLREEKFVDPAPIIERYNGSQ